jgi:hypothetical protein
MRFLSIKVRGESLNARPQRHEAGIAYFEQLKSYQVGTSVAQVTAT